MQCNTNSGAIRTLTGWRGAIVRNGLVIAMTIPARNNRNAASADAWRLIKSGAVG